MGLYKDDYSLTGHDFTEERYQRHCPYCHIALTAGHECAATREIAELKVKVRQLEEFIRDSQGDAR